MTDHTVVATVLLMLAFVGLAGCSAPGEDLAESTQPRDAGGGDAYQPPPGTGQGSELPFGNESTSSDLDTVPGAPSGAPP